MTGVLAALALMLASHEHIADVSVLANPMPERAPTKTPNVGTVSRQARLMSMTFAKCAINHAGYRIQPSLEHEVKQEKEGGPSSYFLVISQQCLDDLTVPMLVMRGSLYNVFFDRKFAGKIEADSLLSAPGVAYPVSQSSDAIAHAYRDGIYAADCVARHHPRESVTLLSTEPASDQENSALPPVLRAFAGCVLENADVAGSVAVQRALLAEAMFRLSSAVSGKLSMRPHARHEGSMRSLEAGIVPMRGAAE